MSREGLENQVMMAARDQGLASVLFRNAIGRRLGLGIADWEALSFVTMRGTATPTQLARYTGLTAGSTTTLLDRLEAAGYVIRKANPDDRRGVLVETTQEYREKAAPLVSGVQQAHRNLMGEFTESELEAVAKFLSGFARNVEEATDQLSS